MTRPTLYLTNPSSRRHHGPGRRLCAMAWPRHFERGDGLCADAAPAEGDLVEVQRTGDLMRYRAACEFRFGPKFLYWRLAPSNLVWRAPNSEDGHLVEGGDTLFCACARPGSRRRTHPCHLELLVPFLVQAGWDVVLDGRRVTLCPKGNDFPGVPRYPGWADIVGEPYDPAEFGWPEVT